MRSSSLESLLFLEDITRSRAARFGTFFWNNTKSNSFSRYFVSCVKEITMNKAHFVALGATLFFLSSVSVASAKSAKEFLTDAIQGNLGEISVGQLAQKNGDSPEVRDFGQMLVQDHSANNDKAKSLAQSKSVTVPTEPKPEAKQVHDKLSRLSGAAFDREFAMAMVKEHKKDIKEFEGQAKSNDDVGKFAQDTLPTLKKHLQTAQLLSQGKATSR